MQKAKGGEGPANAMGRPEKNDCHTQSSYSVLETTLSREELLANMMYGVDENFEAQLPENKFLLEFGYVN